MACLVSFFEGEVLASLWHLHKKQKLQYGDMGMWQFSCGAAAIKC